MKRQSTLRLHLFEHDPDHFPETNKYGSITRFSTKIYEITDLVKSPKN